MIKIKNKDVKSIYLLSAEEAEKLPEWILENGTFWWLRSSDNNFKLAAAVYGTGGFYPDGFLTDRVFGIRPALKIKNLDAMNLKVGEVVEVFDLMAQYIGNNSVLLCENIGEGVFDRESNNYKKSEVKRVIELWLEGKKI